MYPEQGELKSKLNSLVEGLIEARRLSQPRIEEIGNSEGYSRMLKKNLRGLLRTAEKNRQIIEEIFNPLIESKERLSEEEIEGMEWLCEQLLKQWPEEDLDLTLLYLASKRLLSDALKSEDDDRKVLSLNRHIGACYSNLNRFNRIRTSREFTEKFKNEGLEAAKILLVYLEHDEYLKLITDDARAAVLGGSRFYLALYDTWYMTDEKNNELRLNGLIDCLKLADDPWYVEHTPGLDWKKHRIRTLEHMGQLTENGNQWCMTQAQCLTIMGYMDELKRIWSEDEAAGEACLPRIHLELILSRNEYYSGRKDISEYRRDLITLYTRYANAEYDMYSVLANLFLPTEYLATVSKDDLDEVARDMLQGIYRWITNYILNSRVNEAYSFMLEYLNSFLDRFLEIPGEYEFTDMVLQCLAALNPPAYFHSIQLASISKCLMSHLIRTAPEVLICADGIKDANEVKEKKDLLLKKVYNAALYLDIGKISMMDTVIIYGRDLMGQEREVLNLHSSMSRYLLEKHQLTEDYARIAAMHDLNYEQILYVKSDDDPDRMYTLICGMAAAIDNISGSIYEEDKDRRMELLKAEITAGSGTKYEPHLAELFELPEVIDDMKFLLDTGTEDSYRNTYLLLNNVRNTQKQDFNSRLDGIIVRTARIRELSAPQLEDIGDPAEYGILLKQHFQEIGMLATENKRILERNVYPLLDPDRRLSPQEAESLGRFCDELQNGKDMSDIDQSLVYRLSRRLLQEAREHGDDKALIDQLYDHIVSCYEMMHQTKRMKTAEELTKAYREEGLDAARQMWSYLDKEKYIKLDPESRESVMVNSRYAVFMYETDYMTPGTNQLFMDMILKSYAMASDPFYVENTPDYDWTYHKIRCLEYLGQTTECGNLRQFTKEQCAKIAELQDELFKLWNEDPKKSKEVIPLLNVKLMRIRNRYHAGLISVEEYRRELRKMYLENRGNAYDFYSVFPSLEIPVEIIISYEGQEYYSEEEKMEIEEIYSWVISYVFHATNSDAFSLLLEYYGELIYHFIELEGGTSFKQMGLYSMAAMHPPTYIHSGLVGELSRCICRHMLRINPAAFTGINGYKDEREVRENSYLISELCYEAALCHDFGKILMIDTIFVYGRKLLDPEFALLKHHPRVGAMLLKKYPSTRRYARMALGHHKWYDSSKGYPEEFDATAPEDKILTDIVAVADCMDAATDTVGRSYTGGKRPAEIIKEIIEGAGSRYSPEVAACLEDAKAQADVIYILENVRRKNYQKTFLLLKSVL